MVSFYNNVGYFKESAFIKPQICMGTSLPQCLFDRGMRDFMLK